MNRNPLSLHKLCLTILPFIFAVISCKKAGDKTKIERDTHSKGMIKIAVDDSYKSLVDSELIIFNNEYKDATIDASYTTEAAAIEGFLKDSFRMIVVNRKLSASELKRFKKRGYDPKEVVVAIDGIAVIVHPKNPITKLDKGSITDIFKGKFTNWSNINKDYNNKITVVLDNNNGSILRYFRENILDGSPIGKNIFAVNNNMELLNYIEKNEGSIGFIGANLISSFNEQQEQDFSKKVKPLEISNTNLSEAFLPYQAYFATKDYPFLRDVILIINEPYNGLGSGFASFFANDKGQRIVLKEGLLPVNQPIRLIEISPDPIQ